MTDISSKKLGSLLRIIRKKRKQKEAKLKNTFTFFENNLNRIHENNLLLIEIIQWPNLYRHTILFRTVLNSYDKCLMTKKITNTSENQKLTSIFRGNGAEAIRSKSILKNQFCLF